jgi:integrase/recombinase XerD
MADRAESKEVAVIPQAVTPTLLAMPSAAVVVLRQTPNAPLTAGEFFKATLSNEHTWRAYGRIAGGFLSWCGRRGLELIQVTPGFAGECISHVAGSAPTRNQALAALRHFCDALVHRHAVTRNPFASVRGTKYSVTEGKTAEFAIEQARKLLRSIDTVVGRRDGAALGVSADAGARIGAVARLRMAHYRSLGDHSVLRFRGKAATTGRSRCVTAWRVGSMNTSEGF